MKFNSKTKTCSQKNGLILHASAVNIRGKALLFLGHSTTGKTTISKLLSLKYPIIADDKVWIERNKKGEWMVNNGGDFSLTEKLNTGPALHNKKYHLLAIIRIFKSNATCIKPIFQLKACKCLLDSAFEIDIQRQQTNISIIKNWFSLLTEISKKIPCYHLTFKKDISIINFIDEKLLKNPTKILWARREQ